MCGKQTENARSKAITVSVNIDAQPTKISTTLDI